MEIERGTLVLVNGDRIGIVLEVINAPGIPLRKIEYMFGGDAVTIREIIPLRQVSRVDMTKDLSVIFAQNVPAIMADLVNKIIAFNKASANLKID